MTQTPLHRESLALELMGVTLEVQKTQHIEEALKVGTDGLARLGLEVAIVEWDRGRYRLRAFTPRAGLEALSRWVARDFPAVGLEGFRAGVTHLDDLRSAASRWLERVGAPATLVEAVTADLPARAIVAPLATETGGALIVMRDDLRPDDAPLLGRFALQLGSMLAKVEEHERRTAELDLVHTLAMSSTRTDVDDLCRAALESVCRVTGAQAGVLHRFEHSTGEFAMIGDPFGYQGPLAEHYRRFTLPPERAMTPSRLAVSDMPEAAEPVGREGFRYVAIIPLSLDELRVGMLGLFRKSDAPFSDSELRSGEVLGFQMAMVLERQRLYQESQRLYADLKDSYDELGRAQAELVRHERLAALGELAAVMAHEVRNPLGVIFNSLNTLRRLIRPTGDTEMLLSMVGEEADRLNRIVADLLDFARPYELVKKAIAIEPFVKGAIDVALQTLPSSAAVSVRTSFDHDLPLIPVDAHLLRQALINLIVNGAQAMPRGGTLTLTARLDSTGSAPWLVINVKDEGTGLTGAASEKMFQPFFTTKVTGTGLGLAVVKRIVDSHGGEVTATPNVNERGTTFTLRLPAAERESVAHRSPPTSA